MDTRFNEDNPSNKVLVTGGSGFIGTNLVENLCSRGFRVTIFDCNLPLKTNGMNGVEIILEDIRDTDLVEKTITEGRFDGIIHLASVSRVITAEENPQLCLDVNVNGAKNVIRAAEMKNPPWVIFGSSREVYGEAESLPVSENAPLNHVNVYGQSKMECEGLFKGYSKRNGVPVVALRFSNVYGSWFDHETRVTPLFVRRLMSGKNIEINGGGQLFDFTHIDDTVDGIVKTIEYITGMEDVCFDVFHILTGEPHSLQDLASVIAKKLDKECSMEYTPARNYDVEKFYGDPSKAEKKIGYKSKISLEKGIEKTIEDISNPPLRVLKVIHGYPPYYMAGSEVYSYQLANGLSESGVEVGLFTRIENPFSPHGARSYSVEKGVLIERINNTATDYILRDKYVNETVDELFEDFLIRFKPDIVHIGHLSHLSTNIVPVAKKHGIPVVMTIHDFWMFCFRGQMINHEVRICGGMGKDSCMVCLWHRLKDHALVSDFEEYRSHMDRVLGLIDFFIAPSKHVMGFYVGMGVDPAKIVHHFYGFDKKRITYRKRVFDKESPIRFGFTGRIIPVKGIRTIIDAFGGVESESATLDFYGNPGKYSGFLGAHDPRIRLKGPYSADDIDDVLSEIDVLVVPSEWYEVSPLVIQEALLAGLPVITSDLGGMAELIREGVDGFKIPPGDTSYLRDLMQRIVDDPTILNSLEIDPSVVVSMEDHIGIVREIYRRLAK